jgi:hypothetical protein
MAPFGSLEILHTKHRGGHCYHVGLGGPGGTSAHEHLAYRTPDLDASRNKGIDPTKLGGRRRLWVTVESLLTRRALHCIGE